MDIIRAIIDAGELHYENTDNNTDQAVAQLTVDGAASLMEWTEARKNGTHALADMAVCLVNASFAFLAAASIAGLDIYNALAEMLFQAEAHTGEYYLTADERHQAQSKRDAEARKQAMEALSRLFGR